MRYTFVLVVAALIVGSAFGASQTPSNQANAATNSSVVRELRAVRKELRNVNANIGNRYGGGPLLGVLKTIKQSSHETCRAAKGNSDPYQLC